MAQNLCPLGTPRAVGKTDRREADVVRGVIVERGSLCTHKRTAVTGPRGVQGHFAGRDLVSSRQIWS